MGVTEFQELIQPMVERLSQYRQGRGASIRSSLPVLDEATRFLPRGSLVLLQCESQEDAMRLLLHWLLRAAMEGCGPALLFSDITDPLETMERIVCMNAGLDSRMLKQGMMPRYLVEEALLELWQADPPMAMVHAPKMKIGELECRLREESLSLSRSCDSTVTVGIDGLHRIRGGSRKEILQRLRALSRELEMTLVVTLACEELSHEGAHQADMIVSLEECGPTDPDRADNPRLYCLAIDKNSHGPAHLYGYLQQDRCHRLSPV